MASTSAELPPTMKAWYLEEFNTPYVLRDTPLPKPSSPYDLLVKVDAASYCHTDAVLASGQMPPNPNSLPHVGCHEFAGTVLQATPEANDVAKGIKPGTRVGIPGRAFHACGECEECQSHGSPETDEVGYSVYCSRSGNHGITTDGGFREYAVVDARQIVPMPEGLSAVQTAPLSKCTRWQGFSSLTQDSSVCRSDDLGRFEEVSGQKSRYTGMRRRPRTSGPAIRSEDGLRGHRL